MDFAECFVRFQRAASNCLANSDFSLSAQLKVVSLSLLPTQPLWTSLPSHTWSTGSCFIPARCFFSVRCQLDSSKHEKKKTRSADSFAPAAAHPVSRCSSTQTQLQALGLGGEEERLSTGVIPTGTGGDRSCRAAGCSRLHPHQLPLTLPCIYLFFKEFRRQDAHKHYTALPPPTPPISLNMCNS